MLDRTYSERVRHPSGAFNPPRDKKQAGAWWFWILVGLAVLLYFGWRAGMFRKLPPLPPPPPANPFGWK
jgi:hypothetical protein